MLSSSALPVRFFDHLISMCLTPHTDYTHHTHTTHVHSTCMHTTVTQHTTHIHSTHNKHTHTPHVYTSMFTPWSVSTSVRTPTWSCLFCLCFHLHRKVLDQVADVKTQRERKGNKYANEYLIKKYSLTYPFKIMEKLSVFHILLSYFISHQGNPFLFHFWRNLDSVSSFNYLYLF